MHSLFCQLRPPRGQDPRVTNVLTKLLTILASLTDVNVPCTSRTSTRIVGTDPQGYRAEFVQLVRRAGDLADR